MSHGEEPSVPRGTAILYEGLPGAFVTAAVELPEPAEGERLVRILGATICGSDLHTWTGRRGAATPTVLGHEMVGEVVAVGPACAALDARGRDVGVGSRITWGVVASCGDCPPCRDGWPQKCRRAVKYGHEQASGRKLLTGGLASHCLLAAGTTVVALDESLPLAVACPASCATATAHGAVAACGGLTGRVVGVAGCGLLGLTATALAATAGARVIAVEPDSDRRRRAADFGAVVTVAPDGFAAAAAAAAPDGLDAFIEASGSNAAFASGLAALRVGGTLVVVGAVSPAPPVAVSLEAIVRRCITIRGIHNYRPADLVAAVRFLEERHTVYPFAALVSAWYPLAEAAAAFHAADGPRHVRVGLLPPRE